MEVTKVGASLPTLATSGPWEVGQDFLVLKMFVSMPPPTPRQEMGSQNCLQSHPGPLGPEQVSGEGWEDTELCPQPGSGLSCAEGQMSIQDQHWKQGRSSVYEGARLGLGLCPGRGFVRVGIGLLC